MSDPFFHNYGNGLEESKESDCYRCDGINDGHWRNLCDECCKTIADRTRDYRANPSHPTYAEDMEHFLEHLEEWEIDFILRQGN